MRLVEHDRLEVGVAHRRHVRLEARARRRRVGVGHVVGSRVGRRRPVVLLELALRIRVGIGIGVGVGVGVGRRLDGCGVGLW